MMTRLQVNDLAGGYRGLRVFSTVSFTVDSGDILAILGSNGSGKSTILRTLQGLLKSVEGSIVLDGRRVEHLAPEVRAAAGAVLLSDRRWLWPEMTVAEHLRMGAFRPAARPGWRGRARELLRLFRGLPARSSIRPAGLSGGLQQQLSLARFGMACPRVWLLDDPLQGLDGEATHSVTNWIRAAAASGAAVVLTGQHVRALLELAHKAMFLSSGTLISLPAGTEALRDWRVQELLGSRNR